MPTYILPMIYGKLMSYRRNDTLRNLPSNYLICLPGIRLSRVHVRDTFHLNVRGQYEHLYYTANVSDCTTLFSISRNL